MIDLMLSRVIIKGILVLHTMSKSSIIPEKQKRVIWFFREEEHLVLMK